MWANGSIRVSVAIDINDWPQMPLGCLYLSITANTITQREESAEPEKWENWEALRLHDRGGGVAPDRYEQIYPGREAPLFGRGNQRPLPISHFPADNGHEPTAP